MYYIDDLWQYMNKVRPNHSQNSETNFFISLSNIPFFKDLQILVTCLIRESMRNQNHDWKKTRRQNSLKFYWGVHKECSCARLRTIIDLNLNRFQLKFVLKQQVTKMIKITETMWWQKIAIFPAYARVFIKT